MKRITVPTYVRLDLETRKKLEELANKYHRGNLSEMIWQMIRYWLEKHTE